MKKASSALLLSGFALTHAFAAYFAQGILDPDLVGTWVGSTQTGENNSESREWVQIRRADGMVTTRFTIRKEDRIIDDYTSIGRWWTYQNKFFETFDDTRENPDVYEYVFIDLNTIRFVRIADDGDYHDFEPYTFTETRRDG